MSAAVAVPEADAANWPVAPVVRPAAPEPMWSAYQVVFTGWLLRFWQSYSRRVTFESVEMPPSV